MLSVLYIWIKHVYSYWERTKFPSMKPSIPFGNISDCALGRKSMGINLYDLYKSSNEPIVGIYLLFRPALLVRDAELIRSILSTDANCFYDRGVYHNPNDAIANNMLMMTGQEWKRTRSSLTPTFTSGKLKGNLVEIYPLKNVALSFLKKMAYFSIKGMMPTMLEIGERLRRQVATAANTNGIIEIKELTVRYIYFRII